MFAPEMPPVDLPEFFGKMTEFRKVVSEVDISSLPTDKAELFRSLLKEFDNSAATLKEEVPGILDDLRSKYREAVASAENEHASNMAAIEKARQRLADAPAKEAERQRQLKQASDQLRAEREMAEQAQREARLAAKPQTLSFHEGEELVGMLMAVMSPPPPEMPKTIKPSGNIWEEWGKPAK